MAARLAADGTPLLKISELIPILQTLLALNSVNPMCVERWIRKGKSRCRLEAVEVEGKGWCSTQAAAMRFAAGVRAEESAKG